MKYEYWSCSKFADCLRGTPKIHSGTAEEWNGWEKTAKVKKERYWLAEECSIRKKLYLFYLAKTSTIKSMNLRILICT